MIDSGTKEADHRRVSFVEMTAAALAIVAFAFVQGRYACALNQLYYSKYGPFFDSLSYLDGLATLMDITKDSGRLAALKAAAVSSQTVFLPFAFVPFFGAHVETTRFIAVWLQSIWIVVMMSTLTVYFCWCRQAALPVAVALSSLFASIHAIYFYNGGLSDFRMDLQLYLLFGTAFTWFLIALRKQTPGTWLGFGVASGLCCLGRATAPAYLLATGIPVLVIFLVSRQIRLGRALRGLVLAGGVCALMSGWFYAINWNAISYYYFDWNPDANAHLPLSVSLRHFLFARESAGSTILAAAFLCSLVVILTRLVAKVRQPDDHDHMIRSWLGSVEWSTLVLAVAPAAILAISGAGLNPFVSMPSAFGVVFVGLSLGGSWRLPRWGSFLVVGIALAANALSAASGVFSHSEAPGNRNLASGYRAISGVLLRGAATLQNENVSIASLGLGYFNLHSLANHLRFDQRARQYGDQLLIQGRRLRFTNVAPATLIEWQGFPGSDDAGRIQSVVKSLNEVDFLVVPTEETARHLAVDVAHNFINRFVPVLRENVIRDGTWRPVSGVIAISEDEQYVVLRNTRAAMGSVSTEDSVGIALQPMCDPGVTEISCPDSGLELGGGWYPFEKFGGATFRWVSNDATIMVTTGSPGSGVLVLAIEPGPGLGSTPFVLQVRDSAGIEVARRPVESRILSVPLNLRTGKRESFTLHVDGGGRPTPGDPRTLNFRVFRAEWANGGGS